MSGYMTVIIKQIKQYKMGHTEFDVYFRKIRKQIEKELIEALKAHGCEYYWKQEDAPVLAACDMGFKERLLNVRIKSLKLFDDYIEIEAEDVEGGDPVDVRIDDIFIENLPYLIDYIPGTHKVSHVPVKPTLYVYADDGFGDLCHCNNCDTHVLVPIGADICPHCMKSGCLSWINEDKQESSIEDELIKNDYELVRMPIVRGH